MLTIPHRKDIFSHEIFIRNSWLRNKIGYVGGYKFFGELCCLILQGSKVPHIFCSRVRLASEGSDFTSKQRVVTIPYPGIS